MVVALKQFTMAGAHYGPPTDKTPLLAAKTAGEEARAAILAKVWMPGEETERDTRLADCADRSGRANHSFQAAKLSRARHIPDDI